MAISIIPGFAPADTQQSVAGIPAAPETSMAATQPEIPQTTQPDTEAAFGLNPWDQQQQEFQQRQQDWQYNAAKQIDSAALDGKKYFANDDLSFARTPEEGQKSATVDMWLQSLNPQGIIPSSGSQRRLAILQGSISSFGEAIDDEGALYGRLKTDATSRSEQIGVLQEIRKQAAISASVASVDWLDSDAAGYDRWRDKLTTLPGYDPNREDIYIDTWNQERDHSKGIIQHFEGDLDAVWQAIKDDNVGSVAQDVYGHLAPEDRGPFLDAVTSLTQALPEAEKSKFWENIGRSAKNFPREFGSGLKASNEVLNRFADTQSALAANSGTPFARGTAEQYQQSADARLAPLNFAHDLQKAQERYSPINPVSTGFVSSHLEKGLYALPGLVGYGAVAAIPYAGPAALFASASGSAYTSTRDTFMEHGMSDQDATAASAQLAPISGALVGTMQVMGAKNLKGAFPIFDDALKAATDKITSVAGRYVANLAIMSTEEAALFRAQQIVEPLVQAAAKAGGEPIPGVEWHNAGKTGVLDNEGANDLEILGTVLPMALFGAAGGVSKDRRVMAWARTSETQRMSVLGKPELVKMVSDGMRKGMTSGGEAIENAMRLADPTTPEAQAARDQIKASTAAAQEAQTSGLWPKFNTTPDGIQVIDPDNGKVLGVAPDHEAAVKIAAGHSEAMNSMKDDAAAHLATMLQASQEAVRADPESEMALNPQEKRTTTQQASLSFEDADRVRQQLEADEVADGGTGDITRLVVGTSKTSFMDRARQTINKLFGGATVADVVHETTHGLFAQALQSGVMTRESAISYLRSVDEALAKRPARDGTVHSFLPAGEVSPVALDEAVSRYMESEMFRTRKDPNAPGKILSNPVITGNIRASVRLLDPEAARQFGAFRSGLMKLFGVAFSRAMKIKDALKKGDIDPVAHEKFVSDLMGLSDQDAHDAKAAEVGREITGNHSIEIPSSVGRTDIHPTDETKVTTSGDTTMIGPASFSIRAYHGTPHDVGEFTTDKIGSGEGAQVYGWGLYFAESKSVAEIYRRNLSEGRGDAVPERVITGWDANRYGRTNEGWTDLDSGQVLDFDSAEAEALDAFSRRKTRDQISKEGRDILDSGELLKSEEPGNLYQVDIGFDPNEALDWDAGMDDQPDHVMRALKRSNFWSDFEDQVLSDADPHATGGDFYHWMTDDLEPQEASGMLHDLGIKGIQFWDGASRRRGEGTRNYVVFNDADVTIDRRASSLSLRSADLVDKLVGDVGSQIRETDKNKFYDRQLDALGKLKRIAADGTYNKDGSFSGTEHEKAVQEIDGRRERAMSEHDDRLTAAEDKIETLREEQRAKLLEKFGPEDEMKRPEKTAFREAVRQMESKLDRQREVEIKKSEAKRDKSLTHLDSREAALGTKGALSDSRQATLDALATMDGLLSSLPTDLRGKVGGYTQLASLTTPEAQLKYLKGRVEKIGTVIETHLRKEYGSLVTKLFKRAVLSKGGPGEKPVGKATPEVHQIVELAKQAMKWNADTTEAKAVSYETLASEGAANGTMDAAEQDLNRTKAQIIRQFGDWHRKFTPEFDDAGNPLDRTKLSDGADAARRAAAFKNLEYLWNEGYAKRRFEILQQAEDRQIARTQLTTDTGKGGDYADREDKMEKDTGLGAKFRGSLLSLSSFEQVMHFVFGRESSEAKRLVDMEDAAANRKIDATNQKMDGLSDFFAKTAGSSYRGEVLRYEIATNRKLKFTGDQEKLKLTEAQGIQATMMWRQPDGKRHMEGTPSTKWHYTQDFIDQIEGQLSPEAKALRGYLGNEYAGEYARLNPIYRRLYGVDLPKNALYSPITVTPQQIKPGQMTDPVTGAITDGSSFTPGSLKTRGISVSEPKFDDSLQVYIRHTKQMEHWMAYAEFSNEANAILGQRDLRNSIEEKGGKDAQKILGLWIDHFSQGGTRDAQSQLAFNTVLGRMVNRASTVALVGRTSVILIQSLQLGSALVEMPTGSFLKRSAMLLSGQLGWGDAIKSDYIQRRLKELPPLVRQAMEGLHSVTPNRLSFAVHKIGKLIGGADALFTAGTYAMIKDYQMGRAKEMGLTGADAEAYVTREAERLTDRVAQPVKASQRSIYENMTTSPLGKLTWAFASEARQKIALNAWALADRPMAEKMRVLAVTFGVGGVGSALLRAAMRDARNTKDDEVFDAENWSPKRLMLSSFTAPLQGIPVLGNNVEAALYKMAGEYHQEGNLFSNTADAAAGAGHLVTGNEKDTEHTIKDVESLLSGLGLFNEQVAAAGSLSHLARDLFQVGKNASGQH